jgi:hypothetical protein
MCDDEQAVARTAAATGALLAAPICFFGLMGAALWASRKCIPWAVQQLVGAGAAWARYDVRSRLAASVSSRR